MSASSRLMRCVACMVLTHGPPVVRRSSGQMSMPPDATATPASSRLLRRKSTNSTEADHYNSRMHKLVLVRHGESDWNRENRFTGWTDVDLSEKGREEAREGGQVLKREGFTFDVAYTSVLKRAIRTLWSVLDEMDLMWIPVYRSWRLNERHYGTLQGLNKAETAEKFGEAQVKILRRSYDIPPPALTPDDPRFPGQEARYKSIPSHDLPLTEC